MPPVLHTPGGVVRWIIRDMLVHPWGWSMELTDAVRNVKDGKRLRVRGDDGAVVVEQDEKPRLVFMRPGPVRRWRLQLAVRRLAAKKIAAVL